MFRTKLGSGSDPARRSPLMLSGGARVRAPSGLAPSLSCASRGRPETIRSKMSIRPQRGPEADLLFQCTCQEAGSSHLFDGTSVFGSNMFRFGEGTAGFQKPETSGLEKVR